MDVFDKPLFILEMANNHQGSVEHGKTIIKEMKKVCQEYEDIFNFAVKFQYRNLDTFIRPDYKNRMDVKNVKRFNDTRLTKEQFKMFDELLKPIFETHRGDIAVMLRVDDNGVMKTYNAPKENYADGSGELTEALAKVLGEKNVILK